MKAHGIDFEEIFIEPKEKNKKIEKQNIKRIKEKTEESKNKIINFLEDK